MKQLNLAIIAGLIAIGLILGLRATRQPVLSSTVRPVDEDKLDQRLQQAASTALGEQRGTIIVMDPQSGRIRAVVNPTLAFEENLPPGSTIKPFTALAALRSGVIDDESRTVCHEKYEHDQFHTVCSHPRDLTPLNPTEAIAYSCNYYFGKVGERLAEPNFVSTLDEFGFGQKTGVNAGAESQGKVERHDWHSENAIGESDNLEATPIQLINAYSAMVNGGRLFTPQLAPAKDFTPKLQTQLTIDGAHRRSIVKGMRGAVRYGTAETARLYSLSTFIFGKTGTATQINGFRTHGWFVGFASRVPDGVTDDAALAPERVRLAVLVFLSRAHGSDAAQVARPIFDEYARFVETTPSDATLQIASTQSVAPVRQQPKAPSSAKVHLLRENVTRELELEDYVRGVVAAEGSVETEPEALKALAIAVRTYAVGNIGRHTREGYDFCSNTHCQRFRAVDAESAPAIVAEAVNATAGEVLRDNGNQLAESYFSASCGGASANLGTLWGGSAPPHLKGVKDDSCTRAPNHDWTDVISHERLLKALQSDARTNVGNRLADVRVLRRDQSGRAELIAIDGERRLTVKGWDFKIIVGRVLGWNLLKSSRFDIARSGHDFVFRGSGFGHGLGLCQEGAHVMAMRGASHRQILAKYFPGTRIGKDESPSSADLLWGREPMAVARSLIIPAHTNRQTLANENFRVSYPSDIRQREIESVLAILQSSRNALNQRVAAAGLNAQLPVLEIFINQTTGDFVARTGQPPWAAAATKGNRIELQPLLTLQRRRVLQTTLRHELAHVFIDAVGRGRTPRWLAEGLAIHFAGEGGLVARYEPRSKLSVEEIERKLAEARTADEMRSAYAAAYGEVRRMITSGGEANVWRRAATSGQ